jgi:hypothetical protein
MSEHVSDETIGASVRDAERILAQLQLTPQESAWAKAQAKTVMHSVTEELLNSGKPLDELRPVAAAAAIAFALVMTRDWAREVSKLKP